MLLNKISPSIGFNNLIIAFAKVDFPQPDSPAIARTSPDLISNDKFIPDEMGEWKFVYSTLDGSELTNEVPFTVVLKEKE